jgi:hypothetical protein
VANYTWLLSPISVQFVYMFEKQDEVSFSTRSDPLIIKRTGLPKEKRSNGTKKYLLTYEKPVFKNMSL